MKKYHNLAFANNGGGRPCSKLFELSVKEQVVYVLTDVKTQRCSTLVRLLMCHCLTFILVVVWANKKKKQIGNRALGQTWEIRNTDLRQEK